MFKHFLRKDSGSALVELALTVPVLMFMMIGAAELGRMAYYAIEVQNAARAAVAYGSEGLNTQADSSGMTIAADDEAPNVGDLTVTATQSCVCQTINGSTGAVVSDGSQQSASTCAGTTETIVGTCTTATAGDYTNIVQYVNVTTTATVRTMFNYHWLGLGIPSTYTLNGYAQMRVLTTG